MAESRIKRGWLAAQVAAGTALTVYGLFKLLSDTFLLTQSSVLTTIVGLLIGGICSIPFLYHLLTPTTLRDFGLGRLKADRVCTHHEKQIDIRDDFSAWVTVRRTWVFLDNPLADDLFDSYSIDPKLQLHYFRYTSPDAVETGRKRASPNKVTVFWRPKTRIYPFVPYTHEDAWQPPMKYDMPSAMTAFHSIERTGLVTITIRAPFEIERISIFRRPRFRSLRSDVSHMKYALQSREFRWGSAEVSDDKHGVTWRMYEPPPGRTYECVFFRPGGVVHWEQEVLKHRLPRLIAARMRHLVSHGTA